MKKFNKIMSLALVLVMMLSMVACGNSAPAETTPAATNAASNDAVVAAEYVDPYADLRDDYDELSQAIYDDVLGEFYEYYMASMEEDDQATHFALMAIAEAKMLESGIFFPTISKGGEYEMVRIAPYSRSEVLWGNDTYRFHKAIVTTETIAAEDIAALREAWTTMVGTGEYEQYCKDYLTGKGYEFKDSFNWNEFNADPNTWDVLATSNSADSEILVNTYEGLMEYDMENQLQPAMAESWEVSEDGLTYTFHIRQGQVWVDNQGRKVADVTADDWVAGMQHVLDAMGGLEWLLGEGNANIVGVDAYVNGETTDITTVGVKAIDDYTLQYTLTTPTSYFMTMLGYGIFAPMSREYYESMGGKFGSDFDASASDYKYGQGPDSIAYNGPFVVTSFTSNNSIVFKENESYWNVEGNNISSMEWPYNDGSDPKKAYDDFAAGTIDRMALDTNRTEMAKQDGNFDKYAVIRLTDATAYCGFLNVNRSAYANFTDASVGVSAKDDEQKERAQAAMLNNNFRMALVTAVDRGAWNEQGVGAELRLNAVINSYTPGTFVNLPTETTVEINGVETTFPAGTMYGEIVQAQLDADGFSIVAWNGSTSAGYDGWYNVEASHAYLNAAIEELAAQGIEVSSENPIHLDFPTRTDSQNTMNQKQALKKSVEAATNGAIIIDLVEYSTRDTYLDATYWYTTGNEANFDLNDGSGWGPDFGDPQSYLGTMLPQYSGYMTKSLGLF